MVWVALVVSIKKAKIQRNFLFLYININEFKFESNKLMLKCKKIPLVLYFTKNTSNQATGLLPIESSFLSMYHYIK